MIDCPLVQLGTYRVSSPSKRLPNFPAASSSISSATCENTSAVSMIEARGRDV